MYFQWDGGNRHYVSAHIHEVYKNHIQSLGAPFIKKERWGSGAGKWQNIGLMSEIWVQILTQPVCICVTTGRSATSLGPFGSFYPFHNVKMGYP